MVTTPLSLGETQWWAVVLFKCWEEFLPAPGKQGQRPPRTLRGRVSSSLPSFYPWLPPPKQKQVPARLQPSPQRRAAQRGELDPGLPGINLLL